MRLIIGAALAVAGVVTGLALFAGSWQSPISADLATNLEIKEMARSAGIPLKASELFGVAPDPQTNAAQLVLSATAEIKMQMPSQKLLGSDSDRAKRDAELVRVEQANKPALRIAEQASDMEGWYPPGKGEEGDLRFPQLAPMKAMAKALAFRVERRAMEHDIRGVVADIKRGYHLADILKYEPTLIGGLVEVAMQGFIEQGVVRSLTYFRDDSAALESISTVVAKPCRYDFHRMIIGEAYEAVWFASLPIRPGDKFPTDFEGEPLSDKEQVERMKRWAQDKPLWGKRLVTAWIRALIQTQGQSGDLSTLDSALSEVYQLAQESDKRFEPAQFMAGTLQDATQAFRVSSARHLLLQVGIRAIAGRKKPDVTSTMDPLSNQPLQVRSTPNGWLMYSVGADGHNDGGIASTPGDKQTRSKNDIVFEWDGKDASLRGR